MLDQREKVKQKPTMEERLRELKRLHEEGLITDDEYQSKRNEILGDL